MQPIAIVGLDLAKSVFQVHAADSDGKVLMRRRIRKSEVLMFFAALPPCLLGMEACASAHQLGTPAHRPRPQKCGLCRPLM